MNVDELMNADRPLTPEELAFLEEELLKLARELQSAVSTIVQECAPEHHHLVDRLQRAADSTVANIEAAIAVPFDQHGRSHSH
jgi:hypothetical protein